MEIVKEIQQTLQSITGKLPSSTRQAVGGGCINEAFRWGEFFIKINRNAPPTMFATEAAGLQSLSAHFRTPEVIATHQNFLILEWLDLTSCSQEVLGHQLAQMHQLPQEQFGWPQDNFIGSTPQINPLTQSWQKFYREARLLPLLEKLPTIKNQDRLLNRLEDFLAHSPAPALLHGDLWGGNVSGLSDQTPVLFDPACYHGDPEADLAMTQLFGGFSPDFYTAYHEIRPKLDGHDKRVTVYNLYHILNHAILFGESYQLQAERMIQSLL